MLKQKWIYQLQIGIDSEPSYYLVISNKESTPSGYKKGEKRNDYRSITVFKLYEDCSLAIDDSARCKTHYILNETHTGLNQKYSIKTERVTSELLKDITVLSDICLLSDTVYDDIIYTYTNNIL